MHLAAIQPGNTKVWKWLHVPGFVFTSHRLVISPLAISWLSRLGGHQMHGWMDAALAPVRCRAGGRQEHGVVAFKIPVAFETARDHL